jgi:eukaryotic-like serine/threonine-protein kinase
MTLRDRIEWLLRLSLLVFILTAAAFLSAVTAMRFAIRGREVIMPDLVGKSSADAQAIVQARGLHLQIVDRIYSNLPVNAVARQTPPAGEQVKIPQDAHVVLSLGPQDVTVPAVVGESLHAAQIQLLQEGLQLGEVSSYTDPDVPQDTVLQQSPGPATRAQSPRVDLLVAAAEPNPSYVMPWLVGKPLPEVRRILAAGGLTIAKITYAPLPQWTQNTVADQNPAWGSKVSSESAIELVVAQSP